MRQILLILMVFSLSLQAKRMLYTCELVERSSIIGVWEVKDLSNNLMKPLELLKGDMGQLKNVNIDKSRIQFINSKVKDKHVILMFSIYNKNAYIQSMLFTSTSHEQNLKTVKAILEESKLLKKWKSLSVKEQVSQADLIVSGQVLEGKICPTLHYVKAGKFHKGKANNEFSVITVSEKQLNKKSLLLLKKKPGTGPEYRIFSIISEEDSQKYLNLLK